MIEQEADEAERDLVLVALRTLSDVATVSAKELVLLNEDLAGLEQDRIGGSSWRRIVAENEAPNPLRSLTKTTTNLARALGGFRRAMAVGLREEGMQVTEIATLFRVSRQRVSALVRPRNVGDTEGEAE